MTEVSYASLEATDRFDPAPLLPTDSSFDQIGLFSMKNCFVLTHIFLLSLVIAGEPVCAQQGPAPVAVAPVIQEPVLTGQTYVGTIEPIKTSKIGSAVNGRVSEYPINSGDFVKKGEKLAQLLTKTISLELEAAKAELKLREEELRELQNGSRPEEIQKTDALMKAAKAINDYQQKRIKRIESLFDRGAINEDELQQYISETVKSKFIYEETLAAHKLTVDGPRPEKIAQALARVAYQKAIVDKLSDQITKHTLKSPFDGYVIREHTEVGEWVDRGELVAEVVALNELNIVAQVLDKHVVHIKKGLSVRLEIPAVPEELFTGKVVQIIPQADVRSRTFPVVVRVENKITENGPLLKSGMLVRALLPTGSSEKSLMVSKDALVLSGEQRVVYVFTKDKGNDNQGTGRPVPVKLGVAKGRMIQVTGDLKKDDLVIIRGNERVRPGQPLVISEVLNPNAAPKATVKDGIGI